ncbi:MAG: D-glycero-beta-D-manno-heptose 1-phosphate adenylyltransferase [Anaerolineae bacterium]|nr:D-glycero-beta-D-manno-heptose 1-phosphate adenylyltransferase [Anaerolineae bacterium]
MNSHLPYLIDQFARLNVIVIGDAMLDSYLEGTVSKLCREAPVPVIAIEERKDAPGGAANVAANLRSLGARVHFLSVIGDDSEGRRLRRAMEERGIPAENVLVHPTRQTLAKHRVVATAHMLVRFDQGTTTDLDDDTEQALIDRLVALYPRCDAVLVSDYGYGVLTPRIRRVLADLQRFAPRILVVDAKDLAAYRHVGITAVKPNYGEAVRLLGLDQVEEAQARADMMAEQGARVLDITGAHIAAITLDTDGGLIFERGHAPYRTYARPAPHSRAAGAGDTFATTLLLALAAGAQTPAAAELASAAAAVVVAKDGTSTCSVDELREAVSSVGKQITDRARLASRVEYYRRQGQRIVFTNGCFDILHRGHITYLNRAKALGDILIVGMNSDDSIRRLKGESRPINSLDDRLQVLAALSCVDHVVAFDEDTPTELIRIVRPDVFVKGGDYRRESLPEAPLVEELGGQVHLLPYLQDRSTTGIIERIQAATHRPTPQPPRPIPSDPRRERPRDVAVVAKDHTEAAAD